MEAVGAAGSFSECYEAVPDSAARARAAVARFAADAGLGGEQLERVRLVVSEAVTNSVLHAYPDGDGVVHVSAAVADDGLSVRIVDEGRGLRASSPNPGLGLGLKIMERMSDGLVLAERAAGGLEARMRFAISAKHARAGHQARGSVASATSPA